MTEHKPAGPAEQLPPIEALERVKLRALERAQRGTWLQEMEAALIRHRRGLLWTGGVVMIGIPACFFAYTLTRDFPSWADVLGVTITCWCLCVLQLVLLVFMWMALNTTRRVAKDALDALQMRRVLKTYQGEVPVGALEEAGEALAERGAMSLAEGAPEGALSAAQDDGVAPAEPRQ